MKHRTVISTLAAVCVAIAGLGTYLAHAVGAEASSMTLQIEGSTTVGPIADEFAAAFKELHPHLVITVKKTGSGDGAAALIDGRCQIATMSRFMKPKEFTRAVEAGVMPVAHAIAIDAVCVIVHPSNPIARLTIQQIRDIYTGELTNWKDVGGVDAPIVVISRDTSSGTYETFKHFVMGEEKLSQSVEYVSANPQAHNRVATTTGAIAYVGMGFVDEKVKAVAIDNVMPSKETILAGRYPFGRPLFLFTNGYPEFGSPTYDFCTFYLTERGQEIVEAKGFVPVTNY